jgi:hypothetical protein
MKLLLYDTQGMRTNLIYEKPEIKQNLMTQPLSVVSPNKNFFHSVRMRVLHPCK